MTLFVERQTRFIDDANESLNDGLVSWWIVEQDSLGGAKLYDIAGIHDAPLTNMDIATDWVNSTRRGSEGALDFDGTNDWLNVGTHTAYNTDDYTVAAWIMIQGNGGGSGANRNAIIAHALTTTDPSHYYFHLDNADDLLRLDAPFVKGNVIVGSTALSRDVWHHVALTKKGTLYNVYLDGLPDATPVVDGDAPTLAGNLEIGGFLFPGTDNFFNGQMDDIKVYDRGLDDHEIARMYDLSLEGYPGPFVTMTYPEVAAAAIMNQLQNANLGADLYNGTLQ